MSRSRIADHHGPGVKKPKKSKRMFGKPVGKRRSTLSRQKAVKKRKVNSHAKKSMFEGSRNAGRVHMGMETNRLSRRSSWAD